VEHIEVLLQVVKLDGECDLAPQQGIQLVAKQAAGLRKSTDLESAIGTHFSGR
jgi:hypothetical protein